MGSHQDGVLFFSAHINLRRVIIDDLDHAVFRQHDIGSLQIPVDDGRFRIVQIRKAVTQFGQNTDALPEGNRLFLITKYFLQCSALYQFFNDDQRVPILPDGFDSRNIAALVILQICKNLQIEDLELFSVKQFSRRDIPDDGLSVPQFLYLFV